MASKRRPVTRAPSSTASSAPAGRPVKTAPTGKRAKKSSSDKLQAKEEEFMRINAELEAKTSELVREAEELLKGDLSTLSGEEISPLRSSAELLSNLLSSDLLTTEPEAQPESTDKQRPSTSALVSKAKPRSAASRPKTMMNSKPTQSRSGSKQLRIHSGSNSKDIPQVLSIGSDSTPLGEDTAEDLIPQAAQDMGPEATIRFLKAKLRVMQQEMDRLCQENREKEKSLLVAENKLKEISEQSAKVQRSNKSAASLAEKYKQTSEALKHKSDGLEAQLVALRKELDGIKGTQRKAASQQSTVEVRLNRALEETEKYKAALQKARADLKESSKQDQARVEQLTAENKQLERQKSELITAFKKQLKLIDILKRQKMHIEAAKMLSFTEEEFVKALDWGAQ